MSLKGVEIYGRYKIFPTTNNKFSNFLVPLMEREFNAIYTVHFQPQHTISNFYDHSYIQDVMHTIYYMGKTNLNAKTIHH